MEYFKVFAILILCVAQFTWGAKILVMPWAHYSHVNFHTYAAKALQDDGHDVTVMVAEPYKKRVEKAGVKSLVFNYSEEAEPHPPAEITAGILTGESSISQLIVRQFHALTLICNEVLQNDELLETIKNEKFDLILNDNVPFMICLYTIPYKFDIPHISLGMWSDPWVSGLPASPAHEPHPLLPIHGPMNFIERVMNTLLYIVMGNFQYSVITGSDFIRKYAPEKPPTTFKQIVADSEMTLLTTEINCFDFPRISAPNYRFIGSLSGSASPKALPAELEEYMQSAEKGVVIISFGSIIELRSALIPFIQKLTNALGKLEEKAILQFTKKDLKNIKIPNNILVQEWLPQSDLLAHPKARLFIGHGGLNGQLEATYNSIPILTLPYITEQMGNGKRAEAKKHGMVFEWTKVTTEELYEAMRELMDNPEYRNNLKKCSDILKSLPDAKTELVFWVNHILRFGGSHLKHPGAEMDTIEFFMIDIIAFLTGIICILISALYFCIKFIWKRCCKTEKMKSE